MLSDADMLQNLRTLSTLKLNQKLCTGGQTFTVSPANGVMTMVFRSWYGEDRQANVGRLQVLFSLAMLRCELLAVKNTDAALCRRILRVTRQALPGLDCLCQTYSDDVAVVSSLTVLRDDVQAFIDTTDKLLAASKKSDHITLAGDFSNASALNSTPYADSTD